MLFLIFLLVAYVTAVNSFSLRCSPMKSFSLKMLSNENKEVPKEEQQKQKVKYLDINDRGYRAGERPRPGVSLATTNFVKEFGYILKDLFSSRNNPNTLPDNLQLSLSNEAVSQAEKRREAGGQRVEAHPVSRLLYDVGCFFLDKYFDERPIARFWFLEIIARIPYFSYVSMLHLYESFGWLRQPSLRKVHNAEEWNELHHLLIMESLGGDKLWSDRFLGYHCALVYYWLLIAVYAASPRIAYQFMELLEAHAVDTYGAFLKENAKVLKELPPPVVAKSYYTGEDLYYFDDFQVNQKPGTRRPPCDNLFDVFKNICDDENEHVNTMKACQYYCNSDDKIVISPHAGGEIEKERKNWVEWADRLNSRGNDNEK